MSLPRTTRGRVFEADDDVSRVTLGLSRATAGRVVDDYISLFHIDSIILQDPTHIDVLFTHNLRPDGSSIDTQNYTINNQLTRGITWVDACTVRLYIHELINGSANTLQVRNLYSATNEPIVTGPGFSIISFFGLGLPPVITLLEPSLGHGHNRIENVPRDTSMVFDIVDPDSGVAASSIEVLVDGVIAYQHGRWTSGWDGPGSTNVVIDNGYQLTIDPTTNFLYGADVVVVAHATDIAGNPTS